MKDLLLIEAFGTHYEIGYTVGKKARERIIRSIKSYRKTLPEEGFSGPWEMPSGYLDATREAYPHFVDELQGMADGSGLSFSDLFFLNSLEEALDFTAPPACSAIALSTSNEVWLGHNEDWYAGDVDSVIAIFARPNGKPAFISVTAAPFLSAVGINEAGLAQGVNSLTSVDCRVGVPRLFASRAVLEAETIDEARVMAAPANRAGGYNYLLAHKDGEIGNLETSACEEDYMPAVKVAYHTNHYVSPRLVHLEKDAGEHSVTRYRRLNELGKRIPDDPDHSQVISGILRDHENRPRSICKHAEEQSSVGSGGTIFSVLFEPATFSAFVTVGNPCFSAYRKLEI